VSIIPISDCGALGWFVEIRLGAGKGTSGVVIVILDFDGLDPTSSGIV
jgi:hypothetical protein